MPWWGALLGIIASATVTFLSARANREAKRTGKLRFLFWYIPGWGERDKDPGFFKFALGFDQYRTFFFALVTIVFGAYFLEAIGAIY